MKRRKPADVVAQDLRLPDQGANCGEGKLFEEGRAVHIHCGIQIPECNGNAQHLCKDAETEG